MNILEVSIWMSHGTWRPMVIRFLLHLCRKPCSIRNYQCPGKYCWPLRTGRRADFPENFHSYRVVPMCLEKYWLFFVKFLYKWSWYDKMINTRVTCNCNVFYMLIAKNGGEFFMLYLPVDISILLYINFVIYHNTDSCNSY